MLVSPRTLIRLSGPRSPTSRQEVVFLVCYKTRTSGLPDGYSERQTYGD